MGVKFLIGIRESGHYYDEFGNSRADFFEPGSKKGGSALEFPNWGPMVSPYMTTF